MTVLQASTRLVLEEPAVLVQQEDSAKQELLNARIVLRGNGPTTGKTATIAHRVNIKMKNGPKVAAKTAQPASGLGKKKRNVTIVA